MSPRVVEIADVPACDPNVSSARVYSSGREVRIVFESKSEDWPDSDTWSVISFERCSWFASGGPNEEAFHNHPLYALGLHVYSLNEVIDSPFIDERSRIHHKDGDLSAQAKSRHFVFALKESTFECLAHGYDTIGTYGSLSEAIDAAVRTS